MIYVLLFGLDKKMKCIRIIRHKFIFCVLLFVIGQCSVLFPSLLAFPDDTLVNQKQLINHCKINLINFE